MGKLLRRLFVAFVLFLITFIGYSSQIFIIWPWYGAELSMQLLSLLLPFKCVQILQRDHEMNEPVPAVFSLACCYGIIASAS